MLAGRGGSKDLSQDFRISRHNYVQVVLFIFYYVRGMLRAVSNEMGTLSV